MNATSFVHEQFYVNANNSFRSIVICFVVICQFYLKMADDASSSSGCAGNLVDNSINQDELIMKQQREIEKEVIHTFQLVWSVSESEFLSAQSTMTWCLFVFSDIRVNTAGRRAGGLVITRKGI